MPEPITVHLVLPMGEKKEGSTEEDPFLKLVELMHDAFIKDGATVYRIAMRRDPVGECNFTEIMITMDHQLLLQRMRFIADVFGVNEDNVLILTSGMAETILERTICIVEKEWLEVPADSILYAYSALCAHDDGTIN